MAVNWIEVSILNMFIMTKQTQSTNKAYPDIVPHGHDDLLDVIDVPYLKEDERQAMKKLRKDKGKPRKDKGTKRKRPLRDMTRELIERIEAVENVSTDDFVYDTYPQVLAKLKDFLTRVGVTQTMMRKVLGGINHEKLNLFLSGHEKLNLFLSGENANKCGKTYKAAYLFFEKFRILEDNDKSEDREKNETENPIGFH